MAGKSQHPGILDEIDNFKLFSFAGASGALFGLSVFLLVQLSTVSKVDNSYWNDLPICGPSSLHTNVQSSRTQFARDYVLIRRLLKDPHENFREIRHIYEGNHVYSGAELKTWLGKRTGRTGIFTSSLILNSWDGSIRQEAERIDATRTTNLAVRIYRAMAAEDKAAIEAAFREMHVFLLDELLLAIEQRAGDSPGVIKAFQHARNYFADGIEAHLQLQDFKLGAKATASVNNMSQILSGVSKGAPFSRYAFQQERIQFIRIVEESVLQSHVRYQRL